MYFEKCNQGHKFSPIGWARLLFQLKLSLLRYLCPLSYDEPHILVYFITPLASRLDSVGRGRGKETKWKHKNDLLILKLFDFPLILFLGPINNLNANKGGRNTTRQDYFYHSQCLKDKRKAGKCKCFLFVGNMFQRHEKHIHLTIFSTVKIEIS